MRQLEEKFIPSTISRKTYVDSQDSALDKRIKILEKKKNINIVGFIDTKDDLPLIAKIGDAYVVGLVPNDLYICIGEKEDCTPIWKSDPEIEDLTRIIEEKLKPVNEKLDTIEEGAEVNVQSDWNQNDSTKDDYIKNRTHWKEGETYHKLDENYIPDTIAKKTDLTSKMDKVNSATSGDIAEFNSNGEVVDSKFKTSDIANRNLLSDRVNNNNQALSAEEIDEKIQQNSAATIGANEDLSSGFQIQSSIYHSQLTTLTCLEDGPWYKSHDGKIVKCGSQSDVYVSVNDVSTVLNDETLFFFYAHNLKYQRVKLGDPKKPWGAITIPKGDTVELKLDLSTLSKPCIWFNDITGASSSYLGKVFIAYLDEMPRKIGIVYEYDNCASLSDTIGKTYLGPYDVTFPTSIYYCVQEQTATSNPKWILRASINNMTFTTSQFESINSGATVSKINQIALNTIAISEKQDKLDFDATYLSGNSLLYGTNKVRSLLQDATSPNNTISIKKVDQGNGGLQIGVNTSMIATKSSLDSEINRASGVESGLQGSITGLGNALNSLGNEVEKKVDKVDGKGLSTNDFTSDYKTKLDGISTNANKTSVTQTLKDGTEIGSISIDNGTATKLFAPTVNNKTLTINRNNSKIGEFSSNSSTDVTINIEVPTGAAASKGVDTSITASTTSTNLPTSKAVEDRINEHSGIDKVGTITEIKMNGASKGTSGSIDLGTVVTDVSGKADKSSTVTNVSYNTTSKKIQKTINGTTSDVVTLATVATSGSYSDLSNKPSIPSELEWGTF